MTSFYRAIIAQRFKNAEAHDAMCKVPNCENKGSEDCLSLLSSPVYDKLQECTDDAFKLIVRWMHPELSRLEWETQVVPMLVCEIGGARLWDEKSSILVVIGEALSEADATSDEFMRHYISQITAKIAPGMIASGRISVISDSDTS